MSRSEAVAIGDTSVLLNLAFIDRLEVLENQFDKVFVPVQVWEEVLEGEQGRNEIEKFKDNFLELVTVKEDSFYRELLASLDKGESACIAYAVENQIDYVLLDESEGRRKAASHGLDVTGVIGLLMEEDLNMKEELEKLRNNWFWISEELYDKIINSQ